ncbi:MAG: glycosyltransferase family 2 protein [Planctomycetes bacterium]|nr:glycosyltransferase family 2 protein [Planctomycetota bacterium]
MTTFSSPTAIVETDRASPRTVDIPDAILKTAIIVFSIGVLLVTLTQHTRAQAFQILWQHRLGRPLLILGTAYAALTTVWTVWRFILAMRYRPVPSVSGDSLPRISVIVPAFNEGALIADTLSHLAQCHYPSDRLEIIVVDDGSTDETWAQIERTRDWFHNSGSDRRIQTIRLPANRGKRHALYEGFRRATGDILITVDSDSLVDADALIELVSPLVRNPRIGAVAGNVRVLNKSDGLIPRMLDIRYLMTFDFKRAAQSVMSGGGVLCVAGALAAYRRTAVVPILSEWLHQQWLGHPARAGEDHAMTNYIRGQGYAVTFQRTARVQTLAPTTYTGLARMFLRWGRSNVRETAHLASILIQRRAPHTNSAVPIEAGFLFNFVVGATGLVVPYLFLAAAIGLAIASPPIFGLKLLAAAIASGVFPLIFAGTFDRNDDALLAIVYSLYAMLLLSWVWPWALFTSHKSVWMTRTAGGK